MFLEADEGFVMLEDIAAGWEGIYFNGRLFKPAVRRLTRVLDDEAMQKKDRWVTREVMSMVSSPVMAGVGLDGGKSSIINSARRYSSFGARGKVLQSPIITTQLPWLNLQNIFTDLQIHRIAFITIARTLHTQFKCREREEVGVHVVCAIRPQS